MLRGSNRLSHVELTIVRFRIADFGLRIGRIESAIRNPKSAIPAAPFAAPFYHATMHDPSKGAA